MDMGDQRSCETTVSEGNASGKYENEVVGSLVVRADRRALVIDTGAETHSGPARVGTSQRRHLRDALR